MCDFADVSRMSEYFSDGKFSLHSEVLTLFLKPCAVFFPSLFISLSQQEKFHVDAEESLT